MIKKVLILIWLLTKRLYKKPSFIAILLLIPLVVVGYKFAAQQESGMLTIALCCEDPEDLFSNQLKQQLSDSNGVIRFISDVDSDAAKEMVYEGAADAAWIIHKDLLNLMMQYVDGSQVNKGFVTVVIREETVPLLLSNEKLCAKLFIQVARLCFLDYFRENTPEMDDLSDEQILSNFDKERFDDSLFQFSYIDSSAADAQELNYLTIPIRGMLAILIFIGGLAASMYYISDEQAGVFSRIRLPYRPWVEMAYQLICVSNVAVIATTTLFICGWSVNFFKEALVTLCYIVACAAAARLIRLIFRRISAVAVVMSVLVMVMLVVCPVFIALPQLKLISLLFPPTYFIQAAYNGIYILYLIVLSFLLSVLYYLLVPALDR